MSELPRGWALATLPELIGGDGVFSDGDWVETKDQDPQGDVRLTQLADIGDGAWRNRSQRYMTREAADRLSCSFLRPGDVLVARMPDPLGRACVFPGDPRPSVTAVDVCIVRPGSSSVDARWLMWWLNTPQIRSEVLARQAGTTRRRISRKNLAGISFPVPPLEEQRRIVAAIEEDLSRLEAAYGSLTRVQRLLERWRFATLAVLARHRAPQRRIGDVARVGSGATPKRDRPEYWTGGDVPWVTSGQLTRPFVTEPAAFITQKALRETSCRVWPMGTLLVALYGEGKTRGHCSELLIDAATNQACAAIQIHDPDVDRAFLKLYFNATYQANRSLSAGGVQPNLSLGLIKDMTFPCPPVTEQRAIVARIEEELAHADHLGDAVAEALAESAGLRRSILARAFRGELVPQDPNDVPANLLLDRIAAARAARPTPGRKRRVRTPA